MKIGKVAITLAALVIIGLLIFATISNIIPMTFDFITCAFKAFLNPDGGSGSDISGCVDAIEFKFK